MTTQCIHDALRRPDGQPLPIAVLQPSHDRTRYTGESSQILLPEAESPPEDTHPLTL